MLPQLIAQLGVPALIGIIQSALAKIDNPAAQSAAENLAGLGTLLRSGAVSGDQLKEANRHAEEMTRLELESRGEAIAQVNESLRAEIASSDIYVRRMRPTFGYLLALTWGAQMLAVAWVMVFRTDQTAFVLQGLSSLSAIWAVGLSVLGIYVYKRSEEKQLPFKSEKGPAPRAGGVYDTPPLPGRGLKLND